MSILFAIVAVSFPASWFAVVSANNFSQIMSWLLSSSVCRNFSEEYFIQNLFAGICELVGVHKSFAVICESVVRKIHVGFTGVLCVCRNLRTCCVVLFSCRSHWRAGVFAEICELVTMLYFNVGFTGVHDICFSTRVFIYQITWSDLPLV